MTKKIKIGNLNIKLNFTHYWNSIIDRTYTFKTHHFGVFYRKTISIGSGKSGREMFDDDNHVTTRIFGIELGWVKTSISFTFGNIMIFGDR